MGGIRSFARILCGALFLGVGAARAAVMVEGEVIPLGGGVFAYSYSVTNTEIEDLSIVTLIDAPFGDPLIQMTLEAPVGFGAIYDSGLGVVDFIEDTMTFSSGATAQFFRFQSSTGPGAAFTMFEAFTVSANFLSGDVVNRLVPEPSTGACLGLGLAGLLIRRRRGRG